MKHLNHGKETVVSCGVPEEKLKVLAFEGVPSVSLLLAVEFDPSPDRTSPLDSVANCTTLSGILVVRFALCPSGLCVGRVGSVSYRITPSLVQRWMRQAKTLVSVTLGTVSRPRYTGLRCGMRPITVNRMLSMTVILPDGEQSQLALPWAERMAGDAHIVDLPVRKQRPREGW
jgi:hypothetical protein